jgi:hypothetical protein
VVATRSPRNAGCITPQGYPRIDAAQHEELGEARGEGRAVLTVLDARGVEVSDVMRERVLACDDLAQLEVWLRRAVTATTAEHVVRD